MAKSRSPPTKYGASVQPPRLTFGDARRCVVHVETWRAVYAIIKDSVVESAKLPFGLSYVGNLLMVVSVGCVSSKASVTCC